MEATIILKYDNVRAAQAIASAIAPDNFKAPKEIRIETFHDGCQVVTKLKAKGRFSTFIATIDDLLFSASAAEKALRAIEK